MKTFNRIKRDVLAFLTQSKTGKIVIAAVLVIMLLMVMSFFGSETPSALNQ